MFNFSANHLLLLWRMEYRRCVVFFMQDHSTRRVYRLYDFTKSHEITSDYFYCVSGKVNSADKLYLVIESVKKDTKHTPVPRSYDGVGRRGSSTHELSSCGGIKSTHEGCSPVQAVSASVCLASGSQVSGTSQTGQNGSVLNRR
ncbi:MAG: hypothetical protein JO266_20370 [Acidobacteria bacterium]|nr:hypothetical protein [Acidobacteriota bacterium]